MDVDKFSQAEDSYALLKQELAAGRITPEQFQASLRELTVEDPQGNSWALGGDGLKWYRYDGTSWVEADPYAIESIQPQRKMHGALPLLVGAGIGVVLLGLCLTLFALGQLLSVGASGNTAETPSLALAAKAGPQSNITAGALANDAALDNGAFSPTDTPTIINSPAATEELPSATPGIPSATPLAKPTPTDKVVSKTPLPPSAPVSAKAPGVYVSGIQISPAQPKRNQPVTFVVTFLNNTGTPHSYSWLIQIFDAGTQKRFGDTRVQSLTVPVGTSQSTSANSWHVTGPGGCVSFFAQAQFQNPDGSRVPFPAPNGGVVSQKFSVCR